jgi:hypothetical protein
LKPFGSIGYNDDVGEDPIQDPIDPLKKGHTSRFEK